MKKLAVSLSIAAFAGAIFATPIDINFTDGGYRHFINGKQETGWFSTLEDPTLQINITATPFGEKLNMNENGPAELGYDTDGIGVNDDEITASSQKVRIEFNRPVRLHEFEVLDLFYEANNKLQTSEVSGGYFEEGNFTIDDNPSKKFFALHNNTIDIGNQASSPGKYGQLIKGGLDLNIMKSITFGSYNQKQGLSGNNDYAIARIKVTSVPEPNTIMLLGFGLISMLGFPILRKKK